MNQEPPSSRFFNSGPKNALSLSPDLKCDQQTHKNMMSSIMASISRTVSTNPITILPMFLAGLNSPIRLRLFFAGFEGVIMGLDYGKSKC
jgi:hypothetical protein